MKFSTDMPMEREDTSTKELLKELISIPSYSGKEAEIQKYIARFLQELGIPFRVQAVSGDGRYNILSITSPYMVCVHVDTVPPMDMGRKATVPVEQEGKIFGRGASDIKSGIASLLDALRKFKRDFPDANVPVSFAFVVDEENNSALGSEKLLEEIESLSSVLVLEPTYGYICTSQAGTLEFSLKTECKSLHASEFEKATNPAKLLFETIKRIESNLNREVNILLLRSGWKHYATPKKAEALLEIKLFKGESAKDVERKIVNTIEAQKGECRITYRLEDCEEFIEFRHTSLLPKISQAYRAVVGKDPLYSTMPSWTDAANFHKGGLECLVFGFGSLEDSHTIRESIPLSDLIKFRDTLYEFMKIILYEEGYK